MVPRAEWDRNRRRSVIEKPSFKDNLIWIGFRVPPIVADGNSSSHGKLLGAVMTLTRPLACGDDAAMMPMPSFAHMRPNWVSGSMPSMASRDAGLRL